MEELSQKQFKTIESTYTMSIVLFILYLLFAYFIFIAFDSAVQNNTLFSFSSLYIIGRYFVEVFVLVGIIFINNKLRKSLISVSFIIYTVYSLVNNIVNVDFNAYDSETAYYLMIVVYSLFILLCFLFLLQTNGKRFNKKFITILVFTIFLALFIYVIIESIAEMMLDSDMLFSMILRTLFSIYFPVFVISIVYKFYKVEGFYKYFIEAHPKTRFKVK